MAESWPTFIVTSSVSPFSLNYDNYVYLLDATSGSLVINLPDISTTNEASFILKRIDNTPANTVQLFPVSGQLIDRATQLNMDITDNINLISMNSVWFSMLGSGDHDLKHQAAETDLADVAQTLTYSQLLNDIMTIASTSAPLMLTLPTASNLVANVPDAIVDKAIDFHIINVGAGSVQVNVGTGGTSIGGIRIINATTACFRLRFTNVTAGSQAYTLYRLSS
jgi:hypothetical protein